MLIYVTFSLLPRHPVVTMATACLSYTTVHRHITHISMTTDCVNNAVDSLVTMTTMSVTTGDVIVTDISKYNTRDLTVVVSIAKCKHHVLLLSYSPIITKKKFSPLFCF